MVSSIVMALGAEKSPSFTSSRWTTPRPASVKKQTPQAGRQAIAPNVNGSGGYDATATNPTGRVIGISLRKRL